MRGEGGGWAVWKGVGRFCFVICALAGIRSATCSLNPQLYIGGLLRGLGRVVTSGLTVIFFASPGVQRVLELRGHLKGGYANFDAL